MKSRLRSRVTLYFLFVALPASLVSAGAVVVLDRLIAQEIRERTDEIVRQTDRLIQDENQRVGQALERLAELEDVRQLDAAVDDRAMVENAAGLAPARAGATGLDLFAIVAAAGPYEGTIVSSAHLPDAAGDPGPRFLSGEATSGVAHELIEGNPPRTVPALIGIRRVDNLILYGGTRLDGPRLSSIARIGNATLVLSSPPLPPQTFRSGKSPKDGRKAGRTIALTELPGAAEGKSRIDVKVHTPRLETARATFVTLSIVLVGASLLFALFAGTLLSNRITQPIEELSNAAREVGKGNLDVRLAPKTDDEVGALVEVFNDMTEELDESRVRVARAERIAAWREIARRVAHEIKNPLFPIQMSMETLKKSYDKKHPDLDEIVEESTRTVLEEVRALNRIVTEFSEFARLPAPQRTPLPVREILLHVHGLYKDAGVELDSSGLDDLPPVAVDREQIQRALINLVKNAVEATGGGPGSVHLRASLRDGGVWIEVADTGAGIPEEVREKLFTPYFTTKETGTGLGLAIVDRIITEHEGRVDVVSGEAGTTFRIWLPASPTSRA